MAIKTFLGGKSTPVEKEIGICWYADSTGADDAALMQACIISDDLSSIDGLTEAGGIHPDGITIENEQSDSGDSEILRDWSGNRYDEVLSEDSEEDSNTLSFSLLEVLNPNAMRLVYRNVTANFSDEEYINKITGTTKPTDKFIVIEYAIKGNIVREIFPSCSFAGRDSFTIANSELAAHGVTYKINDNTLGNYHKIVFRPED